MSQELELLSIQSVTNGLCPTCPGRLSIEGNFSDSNIPSEALADAFTMAEELIRIKPGRNEEQLNNAFNTELAHPEAANVADLPQSVQRGILKCIIMGAEANCDYFKSGGSNG